MRPPAQIVNWLSLDKMFRWLQAAPDEASHKRRMAIWLTHTGKLHANKVAQALGVSTQAVWLWIRQYNQSGPDGLERKGRGGRRWGFLTPEQENRLLRPLIQRARAGHPPQPSTVKRIIEDQLKSPVSMSYVYRLLQRHNWAGVIAQSQHPEPDEKNAGTFADLAKPWRRED